MSEDVAIAQIVTTITTIFYSLVFAIGYYLVVRGNRAMLLEMKEARLSGGRPQVIVKAEYGRLPMVVLAVRNASGGSATDITFEFSAPIEDSRGFDLSKLPYYEQGMEFLGPGGEVACYWDDLEPLAASLREKGLHDGITVTVRYRDLNGEPYETRWNVNPLLYVGNRHVPSEGLGDITAALDRIEKAVSRRATAPTVGDGDERRGTPPQETRQG